MKYILTFLSLVLLVSCRATISLDDGDFRWIPYRGNEVLVFNSNTKEADTIFLLEAYRQTSPSDPLALFPTNLEHFSIIARRSDPSPPDTCHRYLEGFFLGISASREREPYLELRLMGKDARFYGGQFMYLKDLGALKLSSLQTKFKTYHDIIQLHPESNEYIGRSNFVTRVYWSKSEGLVRYDKKDSVYWELSKKYSP